MNDNIFRKIDENNLTCEEWLKMRIDNQFEETLINRIEILESKNNYLERKNNKLQSNWNSLRECIEKQREHYRHFKDTRYRRFLSELADKMNELEGKDTK